MENMEKYNEVVMPIMKTNDYDMFENILGNRNINDKNLRKLVNSMNKKQLIIPILVSGQEDGKYKIIDGQHRFFCQKMLNLPVYYYVVDNYGVEEMRDCNLVGATWTLDDYLNLHKSQGKKYYFDFEELIKKYGLRVYQMLEIVSALEMKEYASIKQNFEQGNFSFTNPLLVYQFLDDLMDFCTDGFKEYYAPKFTKAFLKLYMYNAYDHKIMQRKLKNLGHKLGKRLTYTDYLSLLVNEIYSYGSSTIGFKYDPYSGRFYDLRHN